MRKSSQFHRVLRQPHLYLLWWKCCLVFAGNGAFIVDQNSFTGFDRSSEGGVNFQVFFEQNADDDGVLSNITCWNFSIDCQPNAGGDALPGIFFMENINDYRMAKNGNFEILIGGDFAEGDVYAIELVGSDGAGFGAQNMTSPHGIVKATTDNDGNQYTDNGKFSFEVTDDTPQNLGISIVMQPGQTTVPSMWLSTIQKPADN